MGDNEEPKKKPEFLLAGPSSGIKSVFEVSEGVIFELACGNLVALASNKNVRMFYWIGKALVAYQAPDNSDLAKFPTAR